MRKIFGLAAVAVLSLSLVGCGDKPKPVVVPVPPPAGEMKPSDKPVEVKPAPEATPEKK